MSPTGDIFVKFDNDNFYKNLSTDSNTMHDYLCTFLITSQYDHFVTEIVFSTRHKVRPQKQWTVNLLNGMGKTRGVYRVLVGKPEEKRPLGRPRRRWEDNIRMDLQEVGLGYEDWIWLAQDRDRWRVFVSAVRNLRVP